MARGVRFILDGTIRELGSVDPTLTVLDWLRGAERRCGSKEGCREGDCGACTVVLVDQSRGELRYRAVNACILFLAALDGKALFTVESLSAKGEPLHPVQKAIVDGHGSQCGFCTPGFVMSLFALYETEPRPSRTRIDEVLAGNLCRCTGYRPIVDAVGEAYRNGGGPQDGEREARLVSQLRSIASEDAVELTLDGRRLVAPRSAAGVADLLERHPEARVLAGGTDLGISVTKEHRDLGTLVYLGGVDELSAVEVTDSHVEVGAAATYTDVLAAVEEPIPALAALIRRIGSLQIRNVGTLVGNVANASPVGDTLPALLALGSSAVIRRGAAKREIALDDFFLGYRKTALGPGEFIERIRIPRPRAHTHFATYKVSKRFDQDISAVCAGFAVELEGGRVREARLCYGGMAPVPRRARAAESALVGHPFSEEAVASVLPLIDAEFSPLSDLRASAPYRTLVARNLLRKFQASIAQEAQETRDGSLEER